MELAATDLDALQGRLHHRFDDPSLLERAMAHRSWCAEQGGQPSNERLEFLGDAVLGLCVTEHIFGECPDFAEGQLAKIRSSTVSGASLAAAARDLGLGDHLLLGRGEQRSGGRDKQSILGDAFEAVVGAVYLDGGMDAARRVVLDTLGDTIDRAALAPGVEDYKTRLQELVARGGRGAPSYRVQGRGPDHGREFTAVVLVDGDERGRGSGTTKKQAEQEAARVACQGFGGRSTATAAANPASLRRKGQVTHG